MPRKKLPVIYVSGPMTGYPDFNFDAFDEAARKLRLFGFPVLNPADFGMACNHSYDEGYRAAIIRDVATLAHADLIVLLPGWEKSKGAGIEFDFHIALGKRAFLYNDEGFTKLIDEHLTADEQAEAFGRDRMAALRRMRDDLIKHELFDYGMSNHPDSITEFEAHATAINILGHAYVEQVCPPPPPEPDLPIEEVILDALLVARDDLLATYRREYDAVVLLALPRYSEVLTRD